MSTVQIPATQVVVVSDTQVEIITAGVQGPAGAGLPAGGATSQLPRKNSGTNFDVSWSGVLVSASDEISNYKSKITTQSSTTYTLTSSDNGTIVEFTNGSAITLTLPNNMPVGFNVIIAQAGAGQITFSAASGATLRNRQNFTKTAAQWAVMTLYVRTNAGGAAAEYVLGGDGSN